MVYSTEFGLYQALEQVLRQAEEPMTCNELFDLPSIKQYAATANRVSDYLGGLFRKRLVVRLPASKKNNSAARWAYQWRKDDPAEAQNPRGPEAIEYDPKRVVFSKPNIEITEDGRKVMIDLPDLSITICLKK